MTSWARFNLISNLIKLDKYVIYADTDSLKLCGKFDINIIKNYNESVKQKIEKVSKELEIDINKFMPKDSKGIAHELGVFDHDASYKKFVTQGAKKYAYEDMNKEIHITVSGVPKKRSKSIKKIRRF